ncbi:TonB-dependent receptor [Hymenobacter lucidus]|uniref:TonB-dependent receptor n=1 Tax=Hymenobacter lucidus TaxID=2880930 RepID=A0ABS8ANU9_9BACT|nr:TonB-dependent receptor [Hymenobacter lucidus]MCB2407109.1 TonB-dependent receptor [Hymenobacter lucidus]
MEQPYSLSVSSAQAGQATPKYGSYSLARRFLATIVLTLLSLAASAQHPAAGTASIRGTVVDSVSGQRLPGVGIRLEGQAAGTASDALGAFRLDKLPAGTYTVRATALGYRSPAATVTLVAGATQTVSLHLAPVALSLREVTVSQPRDPNQSLATITQIDRVLRPLNSAQDLLPLVPGLFIAQHAGGGKAEQIFIRGFDVDHGTDFNVSVDGLPVNMVSHAHGQGYADFHFTIPETVEALNVYKGPYTARFGDFATAGAGEFSTKTSLTHSQAKLELGQFDTRRALLMLDLLPDGKHLLSQHTESAYLAAEYSFTNSYFDAKQDFKRFNGLAKYTGLLSERTSLMVLGSHFTSNWDASGQVPERAIRDGHISRFGSIDPSEGGRTNRTNATATLTTTLPHDAVLRQQAYFVNYNFNLYSNFTFFLENPVEGDEIRQNEHRNIYGYTGTYERDTQLGSRKLHSVLGVGTRLDDVDVALSRTVNRAVRDTIVSGHVYEQNLNAYLDETLPLTDHLTLNAALRVDYFRFNFQEQNDPAQSGKAGKGRVSPKLNLYYDLTPDVQFFARSGFGFHSNDARAVVQNPTANVLPRAIGYEVGSTFKPVPSLVVNTALWALHLQDELVYVGDGGFTESAGRTRRYGVDLSVRYQLSRTLFLDADLNYNHGRLVEAHPDSNRIPLAPTFTSIGGITYKQPSGFSASLRYRHLNDRPANEFNSVRARGYFLLDAVVSYTHRRFQMGASVENLLNVEWNQAQFDTQSRLPGEAPEGVSELHFTPGTPFFLKGNVSVFF